MSSEQIPAGLIILHGERGYIAVRDWKDSNGDILAEIGIKRFEDAINSDDAREAFGRVVTARTNGKSIDDLVGYYVITEDDESVAPGHPSVCVFRVSESGELFVSRDMAEMFVLTSSSRFGVFVFYDGATDLLEEYHEKYPGQIIEVSLLDSSGLQQVYGAVTITKSILENDEAGNSARFGDSPNYGEYRD